MAAPNANPWQPLPSGSVAQDGQGNFKVMQGGQWVDAPKGSLAQNAQGAYMMNAGSLAPTPQQAAPQAPTPAPAPSLADRFDSVASNVGHRVEDMVRPVAGGLGTLFDAANSLSREAHDQSPEQYGGPNSYQTAFEAPFKHPSDQGTIGQQIIHNAVMATPMGKVANVVGQGASAAARYIQSLPLVKGAENSNLGHTLIHDVGEPLASIGALAGSIAPIGEGASLIGRTVGGAVDAMRGTRNVADTVVNALARPSAAARATVASNPLVAQARESGFRLFGREVGAKLNADVPFDPKAVPGSFRSGLSGPSAEPVIQAGNQALATKIMTQDVGLPNTRAVVDSQMDAARQAAAKVYGELGKTVGVQPLQAAAVPGESAAEAAARESANAANLEHHSNFMDALRGSGVEAQSEEARQAIAQQVKKVADQYDSDTFDGPKAVQDVRGLRENAYKQMAKGTLTEQAVGASNLKMAKALEDELMRRVPSTSGLRTTFPAARTSLAKLHELAAVTEGGQPVAARVLNLYKNGAPLTGGALRVAQAADLAPESLSVSPEVDDKFGHIPVGHFAGARAAVRLGSAIVRRLPGMNEATDAFQTQNFGRAGEAFKPTVPGPAPRPGLELTQPPGVAFEPRQPLLKPNTTYSNVPSDPRVPAEWDRGTLGRVLGRPTEAGGDITVGRNSPIERVRNAGQGEMFPPEGGAPWRPPYETPAGSVARPPAQVAGSEEFAAARRRQRLGQTLKPGEKP